jgi:hypothetical protein
LKKRIWILLLLVLFAGTSCTLLDKLGFDTYDYMGEKIERSLPLDGPEATALTDLIGMLINDSDELPPFTRMGDAIREYRDAVLTYMLSTGYLKYSGNTALIDEAEEAYPEFHITQVIPAEEFESVMYQIFGGNVKITHKNGERFQYLPKVNVYVTTLMPEASVYKPKITDLQETQKTYRIRFRVVPTDSGESYETMTREYFALVIKREDGTLYIKRLQNTGDIQEEKVGFFRKENE